MKYIVKVADQSYEVEIEDIYARPVLVRVNGREFEVNPGNGVEPKATLGESASNQKEAKKHKPVELPKQPANPNVGGNELTAPLPGTVIEVFVRPGEQIESGQIILIIEAMKMKNSIRSTRAGTVSEVLVDAGQTVAHKQPLVKFG